MIVRTFKRTHPVNIVFLFILTYLLRLPYLLGDDPIPVYVYNEPLSVYLFAKFDWLWSNKIINVLLTSIIYFIQALWLNKIVSDFSLLYKNTLLPALFYIIISSIFPTFFTLDAAIITIFLLFILFIKLFKLYKTSNSMMIAFDAGMIIAIASLFYFPTILWIVLVWASLVIFRPFNWKEWLSVLVGFAIPYIFIALYYWWIDQIELFVAIWRPLKNSLWQTNIFPHTFDFLPLIPITLIFIISLNRLRDNFYKNVVHVRKCQQLLLASLIITAISYYIKPSFKINHFILLVPSLSVFLSYYFLVTKRNWFSELLVFLLIGSIIYFQLT